MSDDDAADARRVYWHSRRGMLELDLVLMPFAEHVYPGLDAEDKTRYRELLECEDADIFSWVVHREAVSPPRLADIVNKVVVNGRTLAEYPDRRIPPAS